MLKDIFNRLFLMATVYTVLQVVHGEVRKVFRILAWLWVFLLVSLSTSRLNQAILWMLNWSSLMSCSLCPAEDMTSPNAQDGMQAAGINSILPKEHGSKFYSLPVVKNSEKDVWPSLFELFLVQFVNKYVSKWRLLCPPYSAPDRECMAKVYKNS